MGNKLFLELADHKQLIFFSWKINQNSASDDESLIRYLGVKISQAALEFCPGNLPPGVARELSELKQREQGAR